MRIARGIVLLGMALALAACATMSSVQDGQPLAPGEGFLALRIDSNTVGNLWYTAYSPTDSVAARIGDSASSGVHVFNGQRYWLLSRPAGDYMWHQFSTANAAASLRSANRFRVRPGAITYVGHLQVDLAHGRLTLRTRDDEADMRRFLEANFPATVKSYPFVKELAQLGI